MSIGPQPPSIEAANAAVVERFPVGSVVWRDSEHEISGTVFDHIKTGGSRITHLSVYNIEDIASAGSNNPNQKSGLWPVSAVSPKR